ncbi:anti-sigma factor family protein [Actinoallomurus acaciae]|uniref:Anti-sigma factor family protein n=1 Tax=Actinoallomurus acaciae TaxID=502577 RepID=A0ABV5YKW2_9ACTN
MTSSTECSRLRLSLGVYVLGAIEPAERAEVDAHLGVCRRCRDELASLAGLPAMLGRVTEEQVEQLAPPPAELLESVLGKAANENRARRRRERALWIAAAAALIVVVGVGVRATMGSGGTVAERPPLPPRPPAATTAPTTTVSTKDPATGVRAQIDMQPKLWGTAFTVRMSGAPAGSHCHLVATDKKGRKDIAGGWEVQYLDGSASFAGSSMIQRSDLASVEVLTTEGRRLVLVKL